MFPADQLYPSRMLFPQTEGRSRGHGSELPMHYQLL
jgi:hypothetical protein